MNHSINEMNRKLATNILIAAALALPLGLAWAAPAGATFQGALGKLAYWKDEPLSGGAMQHKIFLGDPSDDQPPQQLTSGYGPHGLRTERRSPSRSTTAPRLTRTSPRASPS